MGGADHRHNNTARGTRAYSVNKLLKLATSPQTGRPLTLPPSSNLGLKAQSLIIDPFLSTHTVEHIVHNTIPCSLSAVGVSGPLLKWFKSYFQLVPKICAQRLLNITLRSFWLYRKGPFWDPCYSSPHQPSRS